MLNPRGKGSEGTKFKKTGGGGATCSMCSEGHMLSDAEGMQFPFIRMPSILPKVDKTIKRYFY